MAFHGYVTYDGIEVANNERLDAYAKNGIVPVGTIVEGCDVCEGLGAALGQPSYESPLLDNPPWLDPLNIDTFDFSGVLITEITGVDDATGVVDMTATLTNGAVAARRRYGPRQMGVTAWLTGRTTEGVEAGFQWLKNVLARTCTDSGVDCGPVAPMELLTVCPTPICPTDAESGEQAVYETFTADQLVPNGTGTWTVFGEDDGVLHAVPGEDMTVGHAVTSTDPTVRFTVSITDGGTPITVTFYLVNESGLVLLTGPSTVLPPVAGDQFPTWDLPPGLPPQPWSVVIGIDQDVDLHVHQMEVLGPVHLTTAECLAPYWRTFPLVATVDGPRVIERQRHGDCADWIKVEWIWTSGSPWRYGTEQPLMLASSFADPDGTFAALGVFGVAYSANPADTCAPPVPTPSCSEDPCYPGFTLPPSLPVITDPNQILVDGRTTRGVEIRLDPDSLPTLDGVLSIVLDTTAPKLGVRIRVYDDPAADWSVPDECDAAYGWLIDYIPQNGTVLIDGTTGQATTVCEEIEGTVGITPATGLFGGPLPDPILGCDRRVKIVVEWVTTYPRTCSGVYTSGADQGDMQVSVTTRTREN